MAQLINNVKATGLGVFAALNTSEKSIFTMIGYIIKNRQTAIGMDTSYTERESSLDESVGANLPKKIPAPMQSNTQSVKYFSKIDNPFVFFNYIFLITFQQAFSIAARAIWWPRIRLNH